MESVFGICVVAALSYAGITLLTYALGETTYRAKRTLRNIPYFFTEKAQQQYSGLFFCASVVALLAFIYAFLQIDSIHNATEPLKDTLLVAGISISPLFLVYRYALPRIPILSKEKSSFFVVLFIAGTLTATGALISLNGLLLTESRMYTGMVVETGRYTGLGWNIDSNTPQRVVIQVPLENPTTIRAVVSKHEADSGDVQVYHSTGLLGYEWFEVGELTNTARVFPY